MSSRKRSFESDSPEKDGDLYVPLKYRRKERKRRRQDEKKAMPDPQPAAEVRNALPGGKESLLLQAKRMREETELNPELLIQKKLQEERELLERVKAFQARSLTSANEHAKGIVYRDSIITTWRPPKHVRELTDKQCQFLRSKWHIDIEGEDVPPPIRTFEEMRFPKALLRALKKKGIKSPTPIQVQGLPGILSGRDMVGIAFTGSGKTIVFSLPMIMWSLEEEIRLPLARNDGPVGMVLCPSRELARQIFDVITELTSSLHHQGLPGLRTALVIGGEDARPQIDAIKQGVHMIVATAGRLLDFLGKGIMNLKMCRYLVLDEADRMLDMGGFDEEIKTLSSYFTRQRQTVVSGTAVAALTPLQLFSATFPRKFQEFAKDTLCRPIVVNVGRAGAANLDVIQEIEYVKEESRVLYLLHCLRKTAPPVLVFCENKADVDAVQHYFLLKGVDAAAIHGGKSQEERNEAIMQYKKGKKDVLVATDIAAKGLDFPNVQHVINYDMPKEIENYVHRIGRTGRRGKTGVATTLLTKSVENGILLDLKHLLKEARQRIPPVLQVLEDPSEKEREEDAMLEKVLGKECSLCGGLSHRIKSCWKLQAMKRELSQRRRDFFVGKGDY